MNVVALDTDWGINLFFLKSIVGIFLGWHMPVCTQLRQGYRALISQDYVGEGEREVRVSVDYCNERLSQNNKNKRHIIYIELAGPIQLESRCCLYCLLYWSPSAGEA